jgi:hypothetical protein
MNSAIVDTFISVFRKFPTEAHSIAVCIRDVFLQETQTRSDRLTDWALRTIQKFIREEGHTIPVLRNMTELHPYMDGLPIEEPARDLAAASLLSLGEVPPPTGYVEGAQASASLEAHGYAHAPQNAWYRY